MTEQSRTPGPQAYKHRIAFGCWINDMRNSALPLQQWPAPHCDDATVEGVQRTLDVIADAGYGSWIPLGSTPPATTRRTSPAPLWIPSATGAWRASSLPPPNAGSGCRCRWV